MASLIKRTYRKTLEPRVERLTLLYVVIFTIGFVVGLWQILWMACVRLTWGVSSRPQKRMTCFPFERIWRVASQYGRLTHLELCAAYPWPT